jgi:protein O-mannosyl-transferase
MNGESGRAGAETGQARTADSVRHSLWLFPLIAVVAIGLAYVRAPGLAFVYDDGHIVRTNPYITDVRYVPNYFTEPIWTNLLMAQKNYYRPVFLLWLLGNYEAFGINPIGWHVTSLLLHLGNAVLLYLLALRFTRQHFAALAASLFFGLHPVQVENVVWVSASTEILGTFLALGALLCYLRSLEDASRRALLLSASTFLYALAVLTKETAIILPAIIFLHEWLGRPASLAPRVSRPRAAAFLAALRESLPFGVAALAYLDARIAVLGGLGHVVVPMTARASMMTIPSMLQAYLVHIVWPARLSAFYDYPYVTEFSARGVLLPLVIIVALALALFVAVRKTPGAQLAAIWMVLPLLPALDISVFPRGEFLHDRYLYHPMIGVALLIGIGLAALAQRWTAREPRLATYAAAAVVTMALGIATFHQTGFWTDDFALYSRGVAIAPRSGFANNNLGALLLNRGQWDEAMAEFRKSIEYSPNLYLAHYNMGVGYYDVGRFAEAEVCFKRAIAIRPEYPDSNLYLGMTYLHTNRLPQAIVLVRKAISLKPTGRGYHFALGVMLKQAGDFRGARTEFLEELKLDPRHQPSLDELHQVEEDLAKGASGGE